MENTRFIGNRLIDWYEAHHRDLPWRQTNDPYLIWISEVILQQTRVAQGLDYYLRFTRRFPDVRSLAEAGEDEVMKYWQGLGYYSRARHLHEAARQIVARFGGQFPSAWEDIRSLSGIGDYTAAAIGSFAFGQPWATVDGNVYRVLARLFDVDLPIDSGAGRRYFTNLAQALLDKERPAAFNQAMMEFGALQCVPRGPDCAHCPLGDKCLARARGRVDALPVKEGKKAPLPRYFNYLDIRQGDTLLLAKRAGKDIWRNLYEFPLVETPAPVSWEQLLQTDACHAMLDGAGQITLERRLELPKHVLTHRVIHAVFYRLQVSAFPPALVAYTRVPREAVGDYAVSRLMESYLRRE